MTLPLNLNRWCHAHAGTLGWLRVGGLLLTTLEPPWRDNAPFQSCIPPGDYPLTWWDSPSRGRVLRLHDVPQREDILIHIGNFPNDTEGCIVVGSAWGFTSHRPEVIESRRAMDQLRDGLADVSDMILKIRLFNPYQQQE